jgi:hypothetical protein
MEDRKRLWSVITPFALAALFGLAVAGCLILGTALAR